MMKVDLINVYIQEVTRRLPEKMREDISLELRSTILDMLPDDFSQKNVHHVLEKLGNPAVLASRYRERPMYLIGPKFYESYISILKLVFGIVAIIALITVFANHIGVSNGGSLESAAILLGEAIWALFQSFIQVFFWVTFVFFILDRSIGDTDEPLSGSGEKWTPKDLEHIPYVPLRKKITKGEIVFTLFWSILFFIIYFNAGDVIGIYDRSSGELALTTSLFNQETLFSYAVPVIVLIALEIYRISHKTITRAWTFKLAVSNTLINLASLVVLIIIASDANLIHEGFAPYMAELVNKPVDAVNATITWIKWLIVLSMFVSYVIDSYNGFRKAKIK